MSFCMSSSISMFFYMYFDISVSVVFYLARKVWVLLHLKPYGRLHPWPCFYYLNHVVDIYHCMYVNTSFHVLIVWQGQDVVFYFTFFLLFNSFSYPEYTHICILAHTNINYLSLIHSFSSIHNLDTAGIQYLLLGSLAIKGSLS